MYAKTLEAYSRDMRNYVDARFTKNVYSHRLTMLSIFNTQHFLSWNIMKLKLGKPLHQARQIWRVDSFNDSLLKSTDRAYSSNMFWDLNDQFCNIVESQFLALLSHETRTR